jgi:hypothetical protein
VATVLREGQRVGRLTAPLAIADDPVRIDLQPRFGVDGAAMAVDLRNLARETDQTPTKLRWRVGEHGGAVPIKGELAANASRSLTVPVGEVSRWQRLNASVTLQLADGAAITRTATMGFSPIVRRSPTVDGDLEEDAGQPTVDLVASGEIARPNGNWSGPTDQSGTARFAYDDEHLYVALSITDDVHHQPATGGSMWQGDSLQLGLAPGLPGTTTERYTYTIGRGAAGAQVFRALAIGSRESRTLVEAVDAAIVRDGDTTTYEIAPIEPDGTMGLSMVINDNDGDGRVGWLAWGGGIARVKDPRLYQPMTFVDRRGATPTAVPSPTPTATPTTAPDEEIATRTVTPSPEPPFTEPTATPASGPGVGALGALVALVAGLLARRRSRET